MSADQPTLARLWLQRVRIASADLGAIEELIVRDAIFFGQTKFPPSTRHLAGQNVDLVGNGIRKASIGKLPIKCRVVTLSLGIILVDSKAA